MKWGMAEGGGGGRGGGQIRLKPFSETECPNNEGVQILEKVLKMYAHSLKWLYVLARV